MQPLYHTKIEKVVLTTLILIYHLYHILVQIINQTFFFAKGVLLSEGIFSLDPLPTKSAKSLP